jgi:hypothetical protein
MSESTNVNSRITNDYLTVCPSSFEILIFEWEKPGSEVSLNFSSKVCLENNFYFPHFYSDFSNFRKKFITRSVFYFEIPYKNGIYVIFFNRSHKRYSLKVEFRQTNNILFEKGENSMEVILNRSSKEYIYLKLVNNEEVKYKIDINLQEI